MLIWNATTFSSAIHTKRSRQSAHTKKRTEWIIFLHRRPASCSAAYPSFIQLNSAECLRCIYRGDTCESDDCARQVYDERFCLSICAQYHLCNCGCFGWVWVWTNATIRIFFVHREALFNAMRRYGLLAMLHRWNGWCVRYFLVWGNVIILYVRFFFHTNIMSHAAGNMRNEWFYG